MSEALNKISAYEFFNMLFPGVLLWFYVINLFGVKIAFTDNIISQSLSLLCITYFVGLIISRVGSLVLEPIAKKMKIVKWHEDYYLAEKKDEKIKILLRDMNMYRSIMSLSLIALILTLCNFFLCGDTECSGFLIRVISIVFIFALFGMSYRKQSILITKRITESKRKRKK